MSEEYSHPYELRMKPPVTVEVKYGKKADGRPKKLDHFEVVDRQKRSHDDPYQRIDEVHDEIGTKKPKEVPITLLSDDIDESFSLFRAMFNDKGNLFCGAQYGDDKAKRRFRQKENGQVQYPVEEYDVECSRECPFWQKGNCDLTGALYFQLDSELPRSGELAILRAKGTYAQKQIRSSLEYISKLTNGVLANLPLSLRLHYEPIASSNNYPIPVITVKTRFPATLARKYASREMKRRRDNMIEEGFAPENVTRDDLRQTGILSGIVNRDGIFEMKRLDGDVQVEDEGGPVGSAIDSQDIPDDIEKMMDELGYGEMKKQAIYGKFGDRERLVNHLENEKDQQDIIPEKEPVQDEGSPEEGKEEPENPFEGIDGDEGGEIESDMFDFEQ